MTEQPIHAAVRRLFEALHGHNITLEPAGADGLRRAVVELYRQWQSEIETRGLYVVQVDGRLRTTPDFSYADAVDIAYAGVRRGGEQ